MPKITKGIMNHEGGQCLAIDGEGQRDRVMLPPPRPHNTTKNWGGESEKRDRGWEMGGKDTGQFHPFH
jgi:hypothetical protein